MWEMVGSQDGVKCPFALMQETLATCLFLQGLLLCFGAEIPYLSFIPAPVPPLIPTSALIAARCLLCTGDIPQPPGPPWLLRRYSISPEHSACQPSILLWASTVCSGRWHKEQQKMWRRS